MSKLVVVPRWAVALVMVAAVLLIAGLVGLFQIDRQIQNERAGRCQAIEDNRITLIALLDGLIVSNLENLHTLPGAAGRVLLYQGLERDRLHVPPLEGIRDHRNYHPVNC